MDLVTFGNFVNKEGGKAQITGRHAFKNIKNEKDGAMVFNDTKDKQFSTIGNMVNDGGNLSLSG